MRHLPVKLIRRLTAMAMAGTVVLGLASGPATASAAPSRQVPGSPCVPTTTAQAAPRSLLLGQTTMVSLDFKATCPGGTTPLHVVFVLDESAAMQGTPLTEEMQAVQTLLRGLRLADSPSTKAGVVAFKDVARTLCKLMNDEGRLLICSGKAVASSRAQLDRGIIEGLKVLSDGRRGLGADVEPNEVMVVLSGGANFTGCDPVKSAARRAKGQGVLVIAACIGGTCDDSCLREAASSARYHHSVSGAFALVDVLGPLLAAAGEVVARELSLTATLPAGVVYVVDASWPPAEVSADKKTLGWRFQQIASQSVQVSFRVRPVFAGRQPVILEAGASFRDPTNRLGTAVFPQPLVTVIQIGPTAEPEAVTPVGQWGDAATDGSDDAEARPEVRGNG